jgi:hypothetical protein
MLFSVRNAQFLSKVWFVFGGWNVFVLFLFIFVMFCEPNILPSRDQVILIAMAGAIGLVPGVYITYRTEFSSLYSIVLLTYFYGSFEILMTGGAVALAIILAGHPELRWFAFNTNLVCMLSTFVIGGLLHAFSLGVLDKDEGWRKKIEEHIDYPKRQVNPELTTKPSKVDPKNMIWLIAVGSANIPLLFQIYGGGRANAIFLAAPLSMALFSFYNLKTFGPALARLLLLRRIEKEVGYRFQNADYEQIQELRRGFFLSRWLMKDYRPPQTESICVTASGNRNLQVQTKQKCKKKK